MTAPKDATTAAATLPPIQRLHPLERTTSLSGYTTIITGAASPLGIGRATAHAFAAAGARAIYICDLPPSLFPPSSSSSPTPSTRPSNLTLLKTELESTYPSCTALPRHFDAASEPAVQAVIHDALQRWGRLDVFFANAGIGTPLAHFSAVDADSFMHTLRTNALSVFLAIKHAAPAMAGSTKTTTISKRSSSSRGSIIATASVAGLRSNAGGSDYSASKAAVLSLVQTAAYQLVGSGVRVNAVLPGLTETGMTRTWFEGAERRGTRDKMGQINPMKRAAVADEVARVVAFLAGEGSSYVQGQGWAVDGG